MPDIQTADPHQPAAPAEQPLNPAASRRAFLAGSGALALTATAGVGAALTSPGLPTGRTVDLEASADALADPRTVVAYIRPGETDITIMSGDREVVVNDPALARLLLGKVG